jgi:hypothetical protein
MAVKWGHDFDYDAGQDSQTGQSGQVGLTGQLYRSARTGERGPDCRDR